MNVYLSKTKNIIKIAYGTLSVLTGICFILANFLGYGILSIFIGAFISIIGIIYIIIALKDKRETPENDSILGITILLVGLMFMMPGITEMLLAYVPLMIVFLGLGILIEFLLRKTLKKGEKLSKKASIARIIVSLTIIGLGVLLFTNANISVYSSVFAGVLFISFGAYGILRALWLIKLEE